MSDDLYSVLATDLCPHGAQWTDGCSQCGRSATDMRPCSVCGIERDKHSSKIVAGHDWRIDSSSRGWQPIATAPKDTPVLVYGGSSGDSISCAEMNGAGDWRSAEATPFVDAPTHWMSLPAPPVESPDESVTRCKQCHREIEKRERAEAERDAYKAEVEAMRAPLDVLRQLPGFDVLDLSPGPALRKLENL